MTDQQRPESKGSQSGTSQSTAPQKELADELRELGNHIKDFLHAFWESQERKRVQQEIESGVSNLGESLNRAATEFQQSPTGQQVKEEFDRFSERIRSGEMEATIRRDFINALRTANAELEKALNKMSSAEKPAAGSEAKPKE